MKTILYDKKAPGKLVYTNIEKPVPNDNEVLIKVKASSINAADYRSLKMGLIPKKKIFGADVSGVVESVGEKIRNFKPDDEVLGDLSGSGFGGFAEFVTAPEKALAKKPENISFEDAAALPLAGVTALQALRDKGDLKEGKKVLVIGSGGGVGSFAVQLAKQFGAEVTGVCSSGNAEQTLSLGAKHVIDYTKEDIMKSSLQYDVVLAINGSYPLITSKRLLNSRGKYVMVGGSLGQIFKSLVFGWLFSFGSKKMTFLSAKPNSADIEYLAGLVAVGKIKPVIEKSYPLEKTAEAMHYLSLGHASGKIIIVVE